jgi:hypothetical protein
VIGADNVCNDSDRVECVFADHALVDRLLSRPQDLDDVLQPDQRSLAELVQRLLDQGVRWKVAAFAGRRSRI